MGFFLQLGLLLWKNFTLRKRQPVRVVVEIVWPLVLFVILVAVRFRPDVRENITECHYEARAMPSAGTLSFISSYLCSFNNECQQNISKTNIPGFGGGLNDSLFNKLIEDMETILSDKVDQERLIRLAKDVQLLPQFLAILRNVSADAGKMTIRLADVVTSRANLWQAVANQSINLSSKAIDTLLNASIDLQKVLAATGSSNRTQLESLATFINSWIQFGLTNTSNDAAVEQIVNITCRDKILLEYLDFENVKDATDLQTELCNLSLADATLLVGDIYRNIDRSKLIQEITQVLLNVTKQLPSVDLALLATIPQIISDLRGLSSLEALIRDLSAFASQTFSTTVNGSSDSWLSPLSALLCTGNGSVLSSVITSQNTGGQNAASAGGQESVNSVDSVYNFQKANYEANGITPTCAALFASFSGQSFTRILWRQLEPIVIGVINYAPDSPATTKIIKETNRTFETIANIFAFGENLQKILPELDSFIQTNISALRNFVESPACKNTIYMMKTFRSLYQSSLSPQLRDVLAGLNESLCDQLSTFLGTNGSTDSYTWKQALNNTQNVLSSVVPYFKCFNLDKFRNYTDQTSLVDASLINIQNNTFWTALMFDGFNPDQVDLPSLIQYRIRMDTDKVDSTRRIMDKYWRPGNRGSFNDLKYWMFGFIYIQDMVDHAIIRLQTNLTQEPGIYTQQFPYGCYVYDKFTFAISRSMPLFMVISWIYTVAMIIKGVVYEKEERLKEVMKIMGLGNGVHWLAWFITSFVMMLITVIIFVIILKAGKVLEYSDPSVVFVFMLAFTVSTISQCFLISVFFNKANLAAVCGGFIYFVLYLPYTQLVQREDDINTSERMLASLSSNIAMGYGCSYLSQYEEQTVGAQWHNIGESPMVDDTFNLQTCIGMMFLDSAIYLLITWYIEAVFPGQYGMPRKFYFFLQKSYWCGHTNKARHGSRADSEMSIGENTGSNEDFEKDPENVKVGVAVRNLTKLYNRGDKVAVDGLTLNFYEGQITSFLGHNGAGKTTTMSILTGLFPPTSGTAYIYGRDIMSDIDEIRGGLGMCPQHNVLFDLLTVEEHIWFYARLKGRSEADVKQEMDQLIVDVGLPHKRKAQSKNLSGGMKRKLSVVIAFVGGSRTVILDEPTAGVDPYARRAIWKLLLKFKKDRTIILSTHHMDEADILGDRIAIISQGKLCTVGSSLFLKNRFGSGYYLTLVRQDAEDASGLSTGHSVDDSLFPSSRPSTGASIRTVREVKADLPGLDDEGYYDSHSSEVDDQLVHPQFKKRGSGEISEKVPDSNHLRLTALIQNYVPGAVLVEDNSMELCYRLPENENSADKYQKLFATLEKSHNDFGISSFGISDTSLEEVFLKVAAESSAADCKEGKKKKKSKDVKQNGRTQRTLPKLKEKNRIKTSVFNINYRNRVNSSERLTADVDDSDSVNSEQSEALPDVNFSGAGEVCVKGKSLLLQQLLALFLKRFHHVRRSKKGFISEILLPAAFVCLAMVFALIGPSFSEEPALELQPWMYEPKKGDSSLYTFYSNDNPSSSLSAALEKHLLRAPYYGNRCMNPNLYNISGKPCDISTTSHWTARPVLTGDINIDSPACSCDSGYQRCPENAGGLEPSMLRIPTNDRLYNTTGRNLSDWLVKTVDKYQKRRFGGFSLGEDNPLARMNATQLSSALDGFLKAAGNLSLFLEVDTLLENLEDALKFSFSANNVKVWFNNKGWASSVSYMNAINNVLLRTLLPPGKDPQNFGIVTYNHPMNLTKEQLTEETLNKGAVDVLVAICVIFAMSFVPASFVLFLIEERVSNSKHLQFVSGIKPAVYWLANWAWDMINYAIPALLCILIFLAFGKQSYVSAQNFPCLLALLFLYGWAITPMMYPFSRLFAVPSSAFVFLSCVNVFFGTVSTLATFILEVLSQDDPDLKAINDILKQVFLLLPHYCLGRGLIDMASLQLQSDVRVRLGDTMTYDLFEWKIVGRNLFSMIMLGVGFNILNLLIEYRFCLSFSFLSRSPASKVKNEDIDVARERKRVVSGGANSDVMRLEGLTKVYWSPGSKGKLTAVDHLYIGVPKGQCFGLLGVNGAGKTTTFKMLTGDEQVTVGDAFLNQLSIRKNMVQVRQFMGYCPQFDALDPLLTGREHLEFFARVRGISKRDVKTVADWVMRRLGLAQHGDKISSSYSGGNKRKLSTAIALIGNPPIIFLDEPTTGMDPGARRFLWNCINSIVKSGHSVILTSHSMEECEALCNRLAIMVNGTFQCLGSIQHLKNRFGNGYTIILRVSNQSLDVQPVMQFISSTFASAKLKEKHHNMLQYQLGSESVTLSKIFQAMEEAKRVYHVEDYSVSQTTLDQVFISFAKKQTDLLDEELDENENNDSEDELQDDNEDDNSSVLNADGHGLGLPSHFDDNTLTGSTVELIQPNNHQNRQENGHHNLCTDEGSTANGLSNVSVF